MGGNNEGVQLVRIGLVKSVDCEHETGMDHIAPAPTTYLVTQVGYNPMLVMYNKNKCCQFINLHENNDV
jgi:hypothetical protein